MANEAAQLEERERLIIEEREKHKQQQQTKLDEIRAHIAECADRERTAKALAAGASVSTAQLQKINELRRDA